MLIEYRIDDHGNQIEYDKIAVAIDRLKFAYQVSEQRGLGALYVAFSGGKDSIVIAKLAEMSGVPYELHYNITGIDPPEVVYFMREHYPQLNWHMYEKSMWQLIIENSYPPTKIARYCCAELKERGGENRVVITGVRWAESTNRKNNRNALEIKATAGKKQNVLLYDNHESRVQLKVCPVKGSVIINPIVDWTDSDVWDFIHQSKMPYCELYDKGETRIGCIGCPMSTVAEREADFICYPRFKTAYIRAFDKMIRTRKERGMPLTWQSGNELFNWWLYGDKNKKNKDQIEMAI